MPYNHVFLLTISWQLNDDCTQENEELLRVARELLFWNTGRFAIPPGDAKVAERALRNRLESVIEEYGEDTRSLLVIHYNGHGYRSKETDPFLISDSEQSFEWEPIQYMIHTKTTSDLLLLMDCCFGGAAGIPSHAHSYEYRVENRKRIDLHRPKHELMAAVVDGKLTPAYGPAVYTKRIANHLREIAKSPADDCTTTNLDHWLRHDGKSNTTSYWTRLNSNLGDIMIGPCYRLLHESVRATYWRESVRATDWRELEEMGYELGRSKLNPPSRGRSLLVIVSHYAPLGRCEDGDRFGTVVYCHEFLNTDSFKKAQVWYEAKCVRCGDELPKCGLAWTYAGEPLSSDSMIRGLNYIKRGFATFEQMQDQIHVIKVEPYKHSSIASSMGTSSRNSSSSNSSRSSSRSSWPRA